MNLYCKLPFGQLRHGNPVIIEVAKKLGRTPSALSMKLCNLASFDPVLQARGIKGLQGAARQDKEIWDEFQANSAELAPMSESLLHDLLTKNAEDEVSFLQRDRIIIEPARKISPPTGATEKESTMLVRRGQQFFRQTILTAYGKRCCISGITVPRLLIASHIVPWSESKKDRLNPRNGLCLSALHDAAFDDGLITLDEDCRVVLSKQLRKYFPQTALEQNFAAYEGRPISKPEQLAEPDPALLKIHRETIFQN
jgi:predicted restriction endonuclease